MFFDFHALRFVSAGQLTVLTFFYLLYSLSKRSVLIVLRSIFLGKSYLHRDRNDPDYYLDNYRIISDVYVSDSSKPGVGKELLGEAMRSAITSAILTDPRVLTSLIVMSFLIQIRLNTVP